MFRRKSLESGLIGSALLALELVVLATAQETNPASLPPAKEELLGELSPQTEPPGPEVAKRRLKELFNIGRPEADYAFDPDSLRFAARAKQGNKWVLVVDGKERGPSFEGIESILLSPGGHHGIYSAKRGGQWVKMLDDKELGSAFDNVRDRVFHRQNHESA